jgi:hypothetical protein
VGRIESPIQSDNDLTYVSVGSGSNLSKWAIYYGAVGCSTVGCWFVYILLASFCGTNTVSMVTTSTFSIYKYMYNSNSISVCGGCDL